MIDSTVTIAMLWCHLCLVSAIFDQMNTTATKDSLCSAILTKPPSTEIVFYVCKVQCAHLNVAMNTCYTCFATRRLHLAQ